MAEAAVGSAGVGEESGQALMTRFDAVGAVCRTLNIRPSACDVHIERLQAIRLFVAVKITTLCCRQGCQQA